MKQAVGAVCLSLLLGVSSPSVAQNLEIHYINVGWGSSVFVKGPNGTTVLLEAGNTPARAGSPVRRRTLKRSSSRRSHRVALTP